LLCSEFVEHAVFRMEHSFLLASAGIFTVGDRENTRDAS
jgi:hypothetical protein